MGTYQATWDWCDGDGDGDVNHSLVPDVCMYYIRGDVILAPETGQCMRKGELGEAFLHYEGGAQSVTMMGRVMIMNSGKE